MVKPEIEFRTMDEDGDDTAFAPKAPEEVDQTDIAWLELPTFEPKERHLAKKRIAANVRGPARTAIDLMRTRLLRVIEENDWKRVMVTSPTPNCGKTTVAANLGFAFQRQTALRTIMMDFDLARADLGKSLGLKPTHDVADLLMGDVRPTQQMYRIKHNLAISASNGGIDSQSDILKLPETQTRINEIDEIFAPDVMLFDFPPFFSNDDAIAASNFMDCAIIVGAAGETSVSQIDKAERELSQYTDVAGIVLNKCRFVSENRGYDYPYG
ncbi:MAG: CpsD/CapB family tyrosine-protein kinase [Paracoccaceae bacterium]